MSSTAASHRPAALAGQAATVSGPLTTIYEACESWRLRLVRSPLVMNLNLDDRLAPDAVTTRSRVPSPRAPTSPAGIGGSATRSPRLTPSPPVSRRAALPFVPGWPPAAGTTTRLGSSGERGTRGPACMWKMSLHQRLRRYPWQFSDGAPIRVVGDAAWWALLGQLGHHLVRLPLIIGNYYSDPDEQAEFRDGGAAAEHAKLRRLGLASI